MCSLSSIRAIWASTRSPSCFVKRPPGALKESRSERRRSSSAANWPKRTVLVLDKSRQAIVTVAAPPRSARVIPVTSAGPARSITDATPTSPASAACAALPLLALARHLDLLLQPDHSTVWTTYDLSPSDPDSAPGVVTLELKRTSALLFHLANGLGEALDALVQGRDHLAIARP